MAPETRVRTYLDPDAVGPLPRASVADDSDELAAARTQLFVPGNKTIEIVAGDVIEVYDPNRPTRRAESVAPVGYETAIVLPRRKLGGYVVAAVGICVAVLALAVIESTRGEPARVASASAPPPGRTFDTRAESAANAPSAPNAPNTATPVAVAPAAAQPAPAAAPAAAAVPAAQPGDSVATVGTLLIDSSVDGHRVFVDGVPLSAPAAMIKCGPHEVAIGSLGRTRTIEVPCGGEVTVYR
jgi:hypothetical protein